MSISEDDVLKLVSMAYDAALDELRWPTFLEAFASAVGGCSSLLRSVDLNTNISGFVSTYGYDSAWKKAYCDHFVKMDYLTRSIYQCPQGEVWSNDDAFTHSEERKTELYNNYLLPQDKKSAMGVLLIKEGSKTLLFSAQSNTLTDAWGKDERRLLSLLAPHVTRAILIQCKSHTLTAKSQQTQGALDQLRMGLILVSRLGVPLYLNRSAELMMMRDAGLGIFHNKLITDSPSETAQLHKLIASAMPDSGAPAVGGDMRISMPNKVEYLHCLVAPVSPKFTSFLIPPLDSDCVALFLSKPGHLQLSPKRLVVLYKITPAEARLAAKLAALRTLEESSDDLGISVLTARAQLRSIFLKTETKSQSGLLMLLSTGTLGYCGTDEPS